MIALVASVRPRTRQLRETRAGVNSGHDARVAKLADAPDLGSGGAILRGSSPLPGTLRGWRIADGEWRGASGLAAILEEQHFRRGVGSIVKANGAITPSVILEHAATRAPAVDLVNAKVIPDIQFAPGLDQEGAARFFREQQLQRRTLVFEVGHRFSRFDRVVVQPGSARHSRRRQFAPPCSDDTDTDPRIEASRGVL